MHVAAAVRARRRAGRGPAGRAPQSSSRRLAKTGRWRGLSGRRRRRARRRARFRGRLARAAAASARGASRRRRASGARTVRGSARARRLAPGGDEALRAAVEGLELHGLQRGRRAGVHEAEAAAAAHSASRLIPPAAQRVPVHRVRLARVLSRAARVRALQQQVRRERHAASTRRALSDRQLSTPARRLAAPPAARPRDRRAQTRRTRRWACRCSPCSVLLKPTCLGAFTVNGRGLTPGRGRSARAAPPG